MRSPLGLLLAGIVATVASADRQCDWKDYLPASHREVPCYHVPHCSAGKAPTRLSFNTGSCTGAPTKFNTVVDLCYDQLRFHLNMTAEGELTFHSPYTPNSCNEHIYNNDVMEMFLGPMTIGGVHDAEVDITNYTEIEVAPNGARFLAGVYNPFLTGPAQDRLKDCASHGWTPDVTLDRDAGTWSFTGTLPFEYLVNPKNSGMQDDDDSPGPVDDDAPLAGSVWRANFFRVSEEWNMTTYCTSARCAFNAWSPTMTESPNFHITPAMGILVLD